jgi:hypothetical protein
MMVVDAVVCLGSFLCSQCDGSVRVAARVDRAVASLLLGRDWSPFGRLASVADVLLMWTCVDPVGDAFVSGVYLHIRVGGNVLEDVWRILLLLGFWGCVDVVPFWSGPLPLRLREWT